MTSPQNNVDDVTIAQVQNQLHQADQECIQAHNAVTTTIDFIGSSWKGGASDKYKLAIHDWLDGLDKVRGGLHQLIEGMQSHHQTSSQIEEDNAQLGGSWATL